MFVQFQERVNQSVIVSKTQLGHILVQMFVQVWSKSRSKNNVLDFVFGTIDLLCLLRTGTLSANDLNKRLDFGTTKELKRKIILTLIELGYVAMRNPDKPTSAKQAYKLADEGNSLFNS